MRILGFMLPIKHFIDVTDNLNTEAKSKNTKKMPSNPNERPSPKPSANKIQKGSGPRNPGAPTKINSADSSENEDSDTDQSETPHEPEYTSDEDDERKEATHTSGEKRKPFALLDPPEPTKNSHKPKPLSPVSRQDSKTKKEEDKEAEDEENKNKFKSSPVPINYSKYLIYASVAIAAVLIFILVPNPDSSSGDNYSPSKVHTYDKDWRLKVDPNDVLSNHQQNIIRASLKPILDKSSSEEGVSTLLILSNDEENAAKIARCLLKLVNSNNDKATISTEIDLRSHHGGKLQLDSKLRSLLGPGGAIRAVLLRQIDDNSSDDAIEQARLLFAYCDGENPVIPHRLIIMTAPDNSEKELREKFKTRWPTEHDFVDALFSRISGHTFSADNDQKSIC
ncbi:unnamed protein product [Adineta steineri]|uniref:Uncharacterized protein n=1 Tax=Adineta steineri TaxID=433720 RepID=A0A814RWX8_9BILA|nr:unnamed protein product [Adineta steineri]